MGLHQLMWMENQVIYNIFCSSFSFLLIYFFFSCPFISSLLYIPFYVLFLLLISLYILSSFCFLHLFHSFSNPNFSIFDSISFLSYYIYFTSFPISLSFFVIHLNFLFFSYTFRTNNCGWSGRTIRSTSERDAGAFH